jgi:hypothetical protein
MSEHQHEWQPNGTADIDRTSHSPVSTYDDVLYTDVMAIQSCACGEFRKTRVGRKNIRTRHEDLRARKVS